MPKSMTAWGIYKSKNFTINIRSLNSKYKEINLHLPQEFFIFEPMIYSFLNEKISRGKLDVFFNLQTDFYKKIKIDSQFLKKVYDEFKRAFEKAKIKDEIPIDFLFENVNGIIKQDKLEKKFFSWTILKKALLRALLNLNLMKKKEGEKIAEDIKKIILIIKKNLKAIRNNFKIYKKKHYEQIKNKIKELLNKKEEKNILNKEIILLIEKSDINEEIVRLNSHINQINLLLKNNFQIGKKIDFLTQEIGREINTILAKVQYLPIVKCAIEIKQLNDKIREHSQNLE